MSDSMRCVLVTITATRGSTPRETGAAMLVGRDSIEGTIGGGQLEFAAIETARGLLARQAPPAARRERITLGPDLGQCCGGQVELQFELLAADEAACRAAALRHPADPLYLFGAGHVGRAVVRALAPLPFAVTWIDSRGDAFPADLPAMVTARRSATPPLEVDGAPPGTLFLVMTHSHPLDLDICARALQRDDAVWLGLIGSETKRARFAGRLRAIGISSERIARLTCPIGIAGISGKQPALIAAAVAAQLLIVAERRRQAQAPRALTVIGEASGP